VCKNIISDYSILKYLFNQSIHSVCHQCPLFIIIVSISIDKLLCYPLLFIVSIVWLFIIQYSVFNSGKKACIRWEVFKPLTVFHLQCVNDYSTNYVCIQWPSVKWFLFYYSHCYSWLLFDIHCIQLTCCVFNDIPWCLVFWRNRLKTIVGIVLFFDVILTKDGKNVPDRHSDYDDIWANVCVTYSIGSRQWYSKLLNRHSNVTYWCIQWEECIHCYSIHWWLYSIQLPHLCGSDDLVTLFNKYCRW